MNPRIKRKRRIRRRARPNNLWVNVWVRGIKENEHYVFPHPNGILAILSIDRVTPPRALLRVRKCAT